MKRRYLRGDAASAIYEFLEPRATNTRSGCLPTLVLQERIGWLLKRPVGRPPNDMRRYYASFTYLAGS
jgi:hypothetical protein